MDSTNEIDKRESKKVIHQKEKGNIKKNGGKYKKSNKKNVNTRGGQGWNKKNWLCFTIKRRNIPGLCKQGGVGWGHIFECKLKYLP